MMEGKGIKEPAHMIEQDVRKILFIADSLILISSSLSY